MHQQNHASAYHHRSRVEKELLDHIQKAHYIIVDRKPTVAGAMAAIPKEDGSDDELMRNFLRCQLTY